MCSFHTDAADAHCAAAGRQEGFAGCKCQRERAPGVGQEPAVEAVFAQWHAGGRQGERRKLLFLCLTTSKPFISTFNQAASYLKRIVVFQFLTGRGDESRWTGLQSALQTASAGNNEPLQTEEGWVWNISSAKISGVWLNELMFVWWANSISASLHTNHLLYFSHKNRRVHSGCAAQRQERQDARQRRIGCRRSARAFQVSDGDVWCVMCGWVWCFSFELRAYVFAVCSGNL